MPCEPSCLGAIVGWLGPEGKPLGKTELVTCPLLALAPPGSAWPWSGAGTFSLFGIVLLKELGTRPSWKVGPK